MWNIELVYQSICLAARQGGAVANIFRGKVANEGKELDRTIEGETDKVRAMRTAKTLIDEAVQEIILLSIANSVGTEGIVVDAEEKTSSLSLFPATSGDVSVIIDPIDGTLEYTQGDDGYSVCIGILEHAMVRLAIVFFPARDIAYGMTPNGESFIYEQFSSMGISPAKKLELPQTAQRVVHVSRRTPQELTERFATAGFETKCIDAYSEALLTVIRGESAGYVAYGPQIRDVLLGPIIGGTHTGFMCDLRGKTLTWPATGRIPQAFFGNRAFEKELRSLLG